MRKTVLETSTQNELSNKKFLKKANKFFMKYSKEMKEEVFYIVRASVDGKLSVNSIYFGEEHSPLTLVIDSNDSSKEVTLEKALSLDIVMEFIDATKANESLYLFKVLYKDFKLYDIKTYYSDIYDLSLNIFHIDKKKKKKLLKKIGVDQYSPSLSSFL